jgi:hypothetical protein
MTGEEVNVAYARLEEQVAESRAKLAGLQSQIALFAGNGAVDRATLPALKKLYEGDVAVSRSMAEQEIALKVYSDLALRYEQSRLLVSERGAQLQVMDPAIPPTRRMSASSATLTPLAALAGALIACGILLGRSLLNRLATV